MAQKDIQELAEYMESLEQETINYDKACEEASKEAAEALQEEIDSFEDEVIDKTALGFIDELDTNEADEFYMENDKDTFEEDVSDCLETDMPLDDSKSTGSIQIEVFNEDGYGEYFIEELEHAVPDVEANRLKRPAANGDIVVKIKGDIDSLKKAFAFWTGTADFNQLSNDDKELFDSLLVFNDGDTIAEADYREAVAHCLDPIDVKASTANLIGKDSCALSIVQEEKARRSAKKMLKALKENDFSKLSDDDLDKLEKIQTTMKHGSGLEDLTPDEVKILNAFTGSLGYTIEDWMKLPDREQERILKNIDDVYTPSKTGFSSIHTRTKDDGKIEKYRNQYSVYDKESDSMQYTMFNPHYTSDDSPYQHPRADARKALKDMKRAEQDKRNKLAQDAMRSARGKDTWDIDDFGQMIQNLDNKQRKQLMNALIADIEDENSDQTQAGKEIQLVKKMFGKKLTTRDFGKAWGISHVGISKFIDRIIGALYFVAREVTGMSDGRRALGKIAQTNDVSLKQKFADAFEAYMNSGPLARKNIVDPEREERKRKFRNVED